jgi:hypothetical protein
MEYDLHNNIKQVLALDFDTHGFTSLGYTIDTDNFGSLEYIVHSGLLTEGSWTVRLEQSNTGAFAGEEVTVDPELVLGSVSFVTPTNSYQAQRIGSISKARYERIVFVGSDFPNGQLGAVAVLGLPISSPTGDGIPI